MPDPNLPAPEPEPTPTPTPAPANREPRPCCEFCGCKLTRAGDVLEMSDKAKAMRRHEERIETAERELTQERAAHADTKSKLAAYTATPRESRLLSGGD